MRVGTVVAPARTRLGAASDAALKPGRTGRTRLWHSVMFWRWAALASAALAAARCLRGSFMSASLSPCPRAPLGGDTPTASGRTGSLATIGSRPQQHHHRARRPHGGQISAFVELWLIAPGDQPRSLGLIDPGKPIRINVPADLSRRVSADAALAVSVEPPGGSPTGLPTGPVIASGKLTNL